MYLGPLADIDFDNFVRGLALLMIVVDKFHYFVVDIYFLLLLLIFLHPFVGIY